MARWWSYARLRLPWWLFRRTRPSEVLVLDWWYRNGWSRTAAPVWREPVGPQRLAAPEPTHVCWPVCYCPDIDEVMAAALAALGS